MVAILSLEGLETFVFARLKLISKHMSLRLGLRILLPLANMGCCVMRVHYDVEENHFWGIVKTTSLNGLSLTNIGMFLVISQIIFVPTRALLAVKTNFHIKSTLKVNVCKT